MEKKHKAKEDEIRNSNKSKREEEMERRFLIIVTSLKVSLIPTGKKSTSLMKGRRGGAQKMACSWLFKHWDYAKVKLYKQ